MFALPNAFAFAFDEQVKQLRTLFQLFQTLVYICVLTVNKTFFTKKTQLNPSVQKPYKCTFSEIEKNAFKVAFTITF